MATKYKAGYAVSQGFARTDSLTGIEGEIYWAGWQRHHWPADIIRPGLRVYLSTRSVISSSR